MKEFDIRQLKAPQKLQFSNDKRHLWVADNSHNRVSVAVFNHDGTLVSSLPCASEPFGLAVDQRGDVLVACFDSMSRYLDLVTLPSRCIC